MGGGMELLRINEERWTINDLGEGLRCLVFSNEFAEIEPGCEGEGGKNGHSGDEVLGFETEAETET